MLLFPWRAHNEAFGRKGIAVGGVHALNIGFPGQHFDAESGIWHNGRRHYLPGTGRYLQSDPIGLAGGINTYTYVGANPVNSVDPYGLDDVSAILFHSGRIDSMPNRRGPDYLFVSVNVGASMLEYTLTRNGTVFQGVGGLNNRLNPAKFLASKPGLAIGAGYMEGCPATGAEVDAFVQGLTTSYGASYGFGLSRSTNSAGRATNVVLGTPGVSSDVVYSQPLGSLEGGW